MLNQQIALTEKVNVTRILRKALFVGLPDPCQDCAETNCGNCKPAIVQLGQKPNNDRREVEEILRHGTLRGHRV